MDINEVLKNMNKRMYSSEADFQLSLAMEIGRMYGNDFVMCEYPPEYQSMIENKGRIHIDILYKDEKEIIPIELKYRTKSARYSDDRLTFNLVNQGAHDEGCFGFWKDVCRIDEFKNINKKVCSQGYVIFLTNDSWYQNPDFDKCKKDYKAFSFAGNGESAPIIFRANKRKGWISGGESPVLACPQIEVCWDEWNIGGSEMKYWCCVAKV